MKEKWRSIPTRVGLCAGVLLALWSACSFADRIADIRNTRHNFSHTVEPTLPGGAKRNIEASSESQICVFCHTPHGASVEPRAPLWNRSLTAATYTPYTSGSLDAIDLSQPNGKSKLCLSCHDGTLAIGAVNVLNGRGNPNIAMAGINPGPGGTIPEGAGPTTGFTRRLGTDLTNDHPISFTYDLAQFNRDGELRNPVGNAHVRNRKQGNLDSTTPEIDRRPTIPLEDNKVECISCHDPHIRDTDPNKNIKFLRVNRFQENVPTGGDFDPGSDIICVACHDKEGWAGSAHASQVVGNERYTPEAAAIREFPADTQVWQAACLNCHDPHTVQGSRRILREGTDGPQLVDAATGGKFKQGGNPAIEETCYACHSPDGGTLQGQGGITFEVPDIKTDFTTMLRHMPIANADQPAGTEMHNIGSPNPDAPNQAGKDFVESPLNMGKGNLNNRHAECTDCHNPHRVVKNRLFNANNAIPDTEGTHPHTPAQIAAAGEAVHTNIASGVLRGIWGVEPTAWSGTQFGSQPIAFEAKRGDGGTGATSAVSAPHVTREYQVCLKCHSNYAYDTAPFLGSFSGGTPAGTNNMSQYTNQGMEYQSPDDHKGEGTSGTSGGAAAAYAANNHRSWHPVLTETGRTPVVRAGSAGGYFVNRPAPKTSDLKTNLLSTSWLPPFEQGVGIQTMYCTDCHGSNTATGTAIPNGGEQGSPWGPHGSNNDFLLKGPWAGVGPNIAGIETHGDDGFAAGNTPGTDNHLCFKCHNYASYGKRAQTVGEAPGGSSGFSTTTDSFGCIGPVRVVNLHNGHIDAVRTNFRCNYCHIAIPHGWKNKVFLANLNDVGPEGGLAPGTQVRNNTQARYENGPYYNGSVLKVRTFARSGEWVDSNCGSAGPPGSGDIGFAWMTNVAGEGCADLP
ncbi:MAG: hypothetical protein FD165_1065 [Gammaproteobacteria bacterium]|nr:MAG: hypothetical protein FD165_1065 [Gammaproteobacteria bacterium]TND06227.1 MAG: hypothetical protein FD120_714 [Gammaproteobacteria bacterium]